MTLVIALVILAVVVSVLLTHFMPKQPSPGTYIPTPADPSGPVVIPYATSTVPVPPEALEAVRIGLEGQIAKMPATWLNARRVEDYRVQFVDPDSHTQAGLPTITVGGIQTAGTVRGIREGGSIDNMVIVIPHQAESNWAYLDYLTNTAHNEAEHWSEWLNDKTEFYRWASMGIGDVHPHRA